MPYAPSPNQPPPLSGYNVFSSDAALLAMLKRAGVEPYEQLDDLGALAGSECAQNWACLANENPPRLHAYDRFGNRVDEVSYHPAYHELMRVATSNGLHGAPWTSAEPDAHLLRAVKFYVWGQVEAGHGCPISMTYASVPVLQAAEIEALWIARLTACEYDPWLNSLRHKRSALCGMAMTEKQGGSDVRANATRASRTASGAYELTGQKWFCSAPMSDAFLMLAQAPAGLTCFFVPRVLEDGTRNCIHIERLKDKLGNRSNASAEIELDGACAIAIGEEGRGIQTIVEMVNFTRLDCMNGSAALMRIAAAQAIHHASHRMAFGALLADQPLMQNVLADLAIESEAAMLLLLRVARAVDRAARDEHEALVKRLGTAIGKYYVCKRAPAVTAEALECLGGNGYVEESGMPRIYREAPLNSIWEGSGNINALDVLRIFEKQPQTLEAYRVELEPALRNASLRAAATELLDELGGRQSSAAQARSLVERLALLWQAALYASDTDNPAAEAFIDSRIAGNWGRTLGTLRPSSVHRDLVRRASPAQSVEYTIA